MDAAKIMHRTVPVIGPETSLQAAAQVLRESGAPMLVVMEGERLVGGLYARDLGVEACARGLDPTRTPVRETMRGRVPMCGPADAPEDALERLREAGVDALAVVDDSGRVIGMLTLLSLLSVLVFAAAGEPGPELEHARRVRGEPT